MSISLHTVDVLHILYVQNNKVYFFNLLLFSYSCSVLFPIALPYPIHPTPTVSPAHEPPIRVPLFVPSPSFPCYSPPPSLWFTLKFLFLEIQVNLFCNVANYIFVTLCKYSRLKKTKKV